jgi:hypothetical protein
MKPLRQAAFHVDVESRAIHENLSRTFNRTHGIRYVRFVRWSNPSIVNVEWAVHNAITWDMAQKTIG